MTKKHPWLYFKLKNLASSNTIAGHLFNIIYLCLQLPYIKTILSALFTITISLECKLTTIKHNWPEHEFFNEISHIIITILLYFVFLLITSGADKLSSISREKYIYYKEIINHQIVISHQISSKFSNILNDINAQKSNYLPIKNDLNKIPYQDVCFLVCHAIYDVIKTIKKEEGHEVSIFNRFKCQKSGEEYIKMVAYANKDSNMPDIFNKHYFINTEVYGKKYFHQEIFEGSCNKLYIIKTQQGINEKLFDNDKEDGSRIHQYVAIPVFCEETGIVSLLEISSDVAGLFGNTDEEIEEFVKAFTQYVHLLVVNYYRDRLFNCFIRKFEMCRKR